MIILTGTSISTGIAIGSPVFWSQGSNPLALLSPKSSVLVGDYLSPSEVELLNLGRFSGLALEIGGVTSHTAIMARTFGIPAVFGVKNLLKKCQGSRLIVIDGTNGRVILEPNVAILEKVKRERRRYQSIQSKFRRTKDILAITADGHRVEVAANVGSVSDVKTAFTNGAEGVGVFRTELLYINSSNLPSEDEHYNTYERAVQIAKGKPVIIRTLDIGGDKYPKYLTFPVEGNPFLGLRGIRYCLKYPEVFKPQLSAALRVAAQGDVKLMLPMVSKVEEILAFNRLLNRIKSRLKARGEAHDANLSIGTMIEVPAAVEIIDELSDHLDFFSIGTNDLIQYIEAVDRLNDNVADSFDPYHPAIFRTINRIVKKAHARKKWVGICGEMAADPLVTPALIGLGVDELSMASASIPMIKFIIRQLDKQMCTEHCVELLRAKSSEEITKRMQLFAKANHIYSI
ncbi:MAG: phosphoenolpyruvate-protein phosphotransferase system enzyme [Acidobacteriota bacterium]|jgi:phosphotransferase system enzyme I (PtsI)|nr:phosphoenolpyruvate-protein phosphotransferase system enzyme [Acidobacteriota bacterium]